MTDKPDINEVRREAARVASFVYFDKTFQMYRLLKECETGRNSFGPYYNARKLMRVLHAFTRCVEAEEARYKEFPW